MILHRCFWLDCPHLATQTHRTGHATLRVCDEHALQLALMSGRKRKNRRGVNKRAGLTLDSTAEQC